MNCWGNRENGVCETEKLSIYASPRATSFSAELIRQLHCQRSIILFYFFRRRCVHSGEVKRTCVVLKKEWLIVRQSVLLAEQSPYAIAVLFTASVPLMLLQYGKFVYQHLVYHQLLPSVASSCRPLARGDLY